MIQSCPTTVVDATPERIWELITVPDHYPSWADSTPVEAGRRGVEAGDRVRLRTGPARAFTVVFEILALDPPRELRLDVRLPFGVINHEVIRIDRLNGARCRVTFS